MSAAGNPEIENKDYYTYVTRSAIRLFNEGALTNVTAIAVEPDYGYTTRLSYDDGSFRITYGNDLGLNTGAACDLAKDKGHTKFMLRNIGIKHPEGQEFLLPWWAEQIGEKQKARGNVSMRTTDMVDEYIEDEIGYPAYIKPVSGSKGLGVFRVETSGETAEVIDSYEESRVRVAVVEKAVEMPDYRIVMLDDELISAYERIPLTVTGDGISTVEELLGKLQVQYFEEGRDTIIDLADPRIAQRLGKHGLTLAHTLHSQQPLVLTSVSNLSAGGTSLDISQQLHPKWVELCSYIAHNFNLRLCGIDLACKDIADPEADYSILEINAAPGLDHYASSGVAQQKIVDDLYTKVLNAYPTTNR